MKGFRVTYEIDVDAEGPLEAAQDALALIMDPDNASRYTFDVRSENGHVYRVSIDPGGSLHECEWYRG